MPRISDFIGIKPKTYKPDKSRWPDLFGVELELENLNEVKDIPYWSVKEDNSLRNGVEYVLDSPYAGSSLESAINEFYDAGIKAKNSARTSTHIHINASDEELSTIRSMIILMYTIEDSLFNVVGAARKWSGYACALSEMEPGRLRRAFSDTPTDIVQSFAPGRNQERYYGFNFASIGKHGTVEFRYFPGGPSKDELESWLDLVLAVKKTGQTVSPSQMVEQIQNSTDLGHFLMHYLGKKWALLLMENGGIDNMMLKFNEIATYAAEQESPERREPLVFITEPLVCFLRKKVLNEAGAAYIEEIRQQFGTVTFNDWTYYLNEALMKAGPTKATKATKTKEKVGFDSEADYPAWLLEDSSRPTAPPPRANRPGPDTYAMPSGRIDAALFNTPLAETHEATTARLRRERERLEAQTQLNRMRAAQLRDPNSF